MLGMALPPHIAENFHQQADGTLDLGSPFTALVCRLLADRLEPGSQFARRIGEWRGNPRYDALALRSIGGLHALARSGRCPSLTAAYPPNPTDPDQLWSAIETALVDNDAFLTAYLDSPPQTNEVARSNVILGGCLIIAQLTGLPLQLFEIGSSAGLNLSFDRYQYDLGVGHWGATDAAVRIASHWEGNPPPLDTSLVVVERAGCDIRPLDPSAPEDRERLMSYVWADQFDRLARIEAALAVAARAPWRVEQADAADWVEERLNAEPVAGRARVLFHTIVWQYLPEATRERIESALLKAGARASAGTPLAWFRVEQDEIDGSAGIRLTVWPSGATVDLGRAHFHGRWTTWENGADQADKASTRRVGSRSARQ
jgi:hypothetical protein